MLFRSFAESLYVVSNAPDDSIHMIILQGDYSPLDHAEEPEPAPSHFALLQNFPNPFNPTTKFGMRIAESGMVTLKIYNLLGQEVVMLVNEVKLPGRYEVNWDARGMTSGVYFCRLTSPSGILTKKMVLLK